MNYLTTPILGLAEAEAGLAEAQAKRAVLATRLAAAEGAFAVATRARDIIVVATAAGEILPREDVAAANDALRFAGGEIELLREALAVPDMDIAAAEQKLAQAHADHSQRTFIAVVKRRIELAGEADAIGVALELWYKEWGKNADDISAAFRLNRPVRMDEFEDLKFNRDAAAMIPAPIQNIVIQTNSIVAYKLAPRKRATWGQSIRDAETRIGRLA